MKINELEQQVTSKQRTSVLGVGINLKMINRNFPEALMNYLRLFVEEFRCKPSEVEMIFMGED